MCTLGRINKQCFSSEKGVASFSGFSVSLRADGLFYLAGGAAITLNGTCARPDWTVQMPRPRSWGEVPVVCDCARGP